jgi:hypothetical protein
MPKQNYKIQSKDAAFVAKRVQQIANDEISKIATGKSLTCKVKVFPESRIPYWASILASKLCTSPELAKLTNNALAQIIGDEAGGERFDPTIISKPLSANQLFYVREILRNHGYATDTLVKGTDIKRIVKNKIRTEVENDGSTKFFADAIEIDGVRHKYKIRRNPTGPRHSDLTIRSYGSDVPLMTVLKLRNINIGAFTTQDELARQFAAHEHTVTRPEPLDSINANKSFERFIESTRNRVREVDPDYYTGTQLFETMRTWYFGLSPARQKMSSFNEFWTEMKTNPTFITALQEFVTKNQESDEDERQEITKINVAAVYPTGEYVSDVNGNLVDISTLQKVRFTATEHELELPEYA